MSAAVDPTLPERGYPQTEVPPNQHMPPGGSKWVLPHYLQNLTFMNFVSRSYFWTHDEALRDSECNAEAMLADAVISTALTDRYRPVCQLEWQLEPRNPTDPAEKQLAEDITSILDDIPRFQDMRRCLLEAIWYGRSGVQVVCKWSEHQEGRLEIDNWTPIHGDSLVFKFSGQVGIMCNPGMDDPGCENIEGRGGRAKFLSKRESEVVLIHEFEPSATPYFRQEMAGQVHGSGMRGRVYWFWWIRQQLLRIMLDFLRKAGNGFFLAGYEAGNRTERAAMQKAMEQQAGQPVLYVPIDQNRGLDKVLQHLPSSMTGADFQWMVWNGMNALIRDAILGQSNANKAAPAGLGGSQSEHQGMTDDERVKYDAQAIETPLQKLVNLIAKYMRPNVRPPKFKHLADKRNPLEVIAAVDKAMSWGLVVPKSWVQQELGIPDVNEGDEVLGMIQSQQATAMTSAPSGAPMAGPAGPQEGMQGAPPQQAQPQDDTAQLASQIEPING